MILSVRSAITGWPLRPEPKSMGQYGRAIPQVACACSPPASTDVSPPPLRLLLSSLLTLHGDLFLIRLARAARVYGQESPCRAQSRSCAPWLGSLPPSGRQRSRERLSGRVSPADAKRMPGRVRIHLVALGGIEIRSWLEQTGAEGDRLVVRASLVLDVEVEMHLLGGPMRPARRNMVRRQLHADPPLSGGVDDTVPIVVLEDVPAEIPAQNALSACRSAASNTIT